MGNREILTKNIVKTVDIIQYRLGVFEMIGKDFPTKEGIKLSIHNKDIIDISIDSFIEAIYCLEVDKKLTVIDIVNNEGPGELGKVAEILVPLNFDEITENYDREKIENQKTEGGEIVKIEIKKEEREYKNITIFINTNYQKPRSYKRGKNWGKMYELAKEHVVTYDKGFFDYFNSNKTNPLYAKEGFKVTKILKQENDTITPNVTIKLTTQKAVTQRLKSA